MTTIGIAQVGVALILVLVAGRLGGQIARHVGQPRVIGEIAVGLLVIPLLSGWAGATATSHLLPDHVLDVLRRFGELGLMLFVVGVAHDIDLFGSGRRSRRELKWVTTGTFLPSFLAGLALAGWVTWSAGPDLRGIASIPAFALTLAVAMSVTAVPVLARIVVDRSMTETWEGSVALGAAVVVDAIAWTLLAVAVALASSRASDAFEAALTGAALLVGCFAVLVGARRVLRARAVLVFVARLAALHPGVVCALLGATTVIAAEAARISGLPALLGAFLVGLAIPRTSAESPWRRPVEQVGRLGRSLVPVFFVVTGLAVMPDAFSARHWEVAAVATGLATLSKMGGAYVAARASGRSISTGLRLGALVNTRGLTEIIVLQAAYSAGILTLPLFGAMLIMTLITTAATGPMLSAIEHWTHDRPTRKRLNEGVPQWAQ